MQETAVLPRAEAGAAGAAAQGALPLTPKIYSTPIAVNGDIGRGRLRLDIDALKTERYMSNPVVLYNHGSGAPFPVARSLGIRRERGERGAELHADFVFAQNDPEAARVENLWDQKVLKATSVTWSRDNELLEWSIVPVGADPDAHQRSHHFQGEDKSMTDQTPESRSEVPPPAAAAPAQAQISDDQMQRLAETIIAAQRSVEAPERPAPSAPSAPQLDEDALAEKIGQTVASSLADALKSVIQPPAAAPAAKPSEQPAPPPAPPPTAETPVEQPPEASAPDAAASSDAGFAEQVRRRSELIEMTRAMLPTDFDVHSRSEHDILVAAVGPEQADGRSDDFLRGVVASRHVTRLEAAGQRTEFAGLVRQPTLPKSAERKYDGYLPGDSDPTMAFEIEDRRTAFGDHVDWITNAWRNMPDKDGN